jgi:ribosomal protein L11 methyltransferase
MIELRQEIPAELTQPLEDWFCGLTRSSWMLYHEGPGKPHYVMGYFETREEAAAAWAELRRSFRRLPETCPMGELADRDWKEAYKEHLKPWSHGRLHWVPSWMRGNHEVPAKAAVIWFDAGLAFGTGDHPTTRLCAIRLMEFMEGRDARALRVTDAGCGSGILALSAARLGCGQVAGFDRDPEAVRVSLANREENGIPAEAVALAHHGLEAGLPWAGAADVVLANIISDVLLIYADNLLASTAPGGVLALSGILATEQARVRSHFEEKARVAWGGCRSDGRVMGEWSDVALFRPTGLPSARSSPQSPA